MRTINELSKYLEEKQIEHDVEVHGFSADAYAYTMAERKLKLIKNITPEGFVAAIEREIRTEAQFVKKVSLTPTRQNVKQWVSGGLAILVYLDLLEWMKTEEKEVVLHDITRYE